jgi:predicted phage terminase large subunit-like protein
MSFAILPHEAAQTLLDRQAALASFTDWCKFVGYMPALHHELIIKHLEAVARGESKRLQLLLPPGSAKSTYASVLFPPWYLAQHHDHAMIAASHTDELAERWGRRCRNLIEEHRYALEISLSPDSKAAGRWETREGAEYYAAGVGASITGRRADLVLIDDPVRNREDADSKLSRDKAWDWYLFDLLPRLKPDAAIVLIQTRWHEDDLAGRILEAEPGQWTVVKVPMEAETDDPLGRAPGERLWPEWFTADMVATAKRDKRVWSALYQQTPTPDTGAYFLDDWLHPVSHMPARQGLNVYGASDYAVTADGGDYTVHIVVGVDDDGDMYVLDLWRGQTDSATWIDEWCDLVKLWKPIQWAEEAGQINASIGPFLQRRAREREAYTFRRQFPPRHDKAVRAQSIRARMATLGLYLPAGAPWRAELEAELLRFPAGKHDDQVDALGLIEQLLDAIRKADLPPDPKEPKNPSGYSALRKPREQRPFSAIDI